MRIELQDYTLSIHERNIRLISNSTNEYIDMMLFTDYNYDILEIGLGLGCLDKTILKAEYCKIGENEYYDLSISITMKENIYIHINGINMDNNETEDIINIEDKVIYVNNEM